MMENTQALGAIGISQQVTANNIANMNTNGFRSSRVDLETGPDGQGVRVQDIVENTRSGPLVPGGQYVREDGIERDEERLVEGSNTDLTTEAVQMIEDELAFTANAVAIRTQAEMTGTVIDMMV